MGDDVLETASERVAAIIQAKDGDNRDPSTVVGKPEELS
jgi:hypothetical protein